MAMKSGDVIKGEGYAPEKIKRRGVSSKNWEKERGTKKSLAHKYKGDLKAHARALLIEIHNSDLPKDKKEELSRHIKSGMKHLDKPKGAIVKHYNKLAAEVQEAQKALASETSKKTKGSKKSKETSSAPSPDGFTNKELREVPGDRTVDHQKAIENSPEASGSEESGESEASASFEDFDPQEYARLMMEDPEAAMEMLDGMDPKEKTQAMNMGQNYLQQIQRMAQLQSNMMKMMHKTQSSIIRNIQ